MPSANSTSKRDRPAPPPNPGPDKKPRDIASRPRKPKPFDPLVEEDKAISDGVANVEANAWVPILPVPDDAPEPDLKHYRYGNHSAVWTYRDSNGGLIGYVCRFDEKQSDGKVGKQILTRVFCQKPDGRRAWQWKGFPTPRPLFGVDRLEARPKAPVLIVEGEKTAEAAGKLFPDFVVVTWPGGSNAVLHADWSALAGRIVRIWPDADKSGHKAASIVEQACTKAGGQEVTVVKIPGNFPKGWDLADQAPEGWTTKRLRQLLDVEVQPAGSNPFADQHPYEATRNGLIFWKQTNNGPIAIPLANFSAKIVAEILQDDGAELTRFFEIESQQANGFRRKITVSAADFERLSWVTRELGAQAIIYPGYIKEHVRAAIQFLSGPVETRYSYGHTGWRQIDGGNVYLHALGAIGQNGQLDSVQTDLSAQGLIDFALPEPSDHKKARSEVRTSLNLLPLAPDSVVIPLYCALWRSVLGPAPFSIHVTGPTGAGKTELVALVQQHFGPSLHAKNLPGTWMSTANALEAQAFAAKDAILVVDDFAPSGTAQERGRQQRDAARLLRAQGNQTGRVRMRSDASLRPTKAPRGLIISTGEDIPTQHSIRARTLVVEVDPNDVNFELLSNAQEAAANGIYASAMAAYLKWLAPQIDQIRKTLPGIAQRYRNDLAIAGQHRRTPDALGELAAGAEIFLRFALEIAAVTPEEAAQLWERIKDALSRMGSAQQSHQDTANPVQRFINLIASALSSGEAHLASKDGSMPSDFQKWGWRRVEENNPGSTPWVQHQGRRIGWVDGNDIYLDASSAMKAANQIASDGESLPITEQTLGKRLRESGLLATVDSQRSKLKVRRTLEGTRRKVLHLKTSSIFPD